MQEIIAGVSWAGVFVGAIAAFLVAWVWYSPKVFGTKWAEGSGVDIGEARDMPVGPLIVCVMYYANGMFGQRSAYARGVDVGYWIVALVVMIIAQAIF